MTSLRKILMACGASAFTGVAAYSWLHQGTDDYNASVATTRAALSEHPAMVDFVRYATLAANGHNTQPWKFRVAKNRVDIMPDFSRRTPVVDPDDHHLFASLGCAAENLGVAAAAHGHPGVIAFNQAGEGSVTITLEGGPTAHPGLFEAIPLRQSTRAEFDGRSVSAADLARLASTATVPGVDLVLITERSRIESVRDLILSANHAQMNDSAFVSELKKWLRYSPQQAIATGDGLFAGTSGNPALPAWLGPLLLSLVFKTDAENDKYARQIRSSAGLAVFVSQRNDKEHWMLAGRASQRFALQATALGLKHAFLNQPVEVEHFRPELAALVGMQGRRPDLVMRFGYGTALPFSARRPVQAVLA